MLNKKKGFIKLPRTFMDWQWYQDVNTAKLMVHLLLKANFETKQWQGQTIYPGQLISSFEKLSIETGLSISKIRTALEKLKSTNEIQVVTTNKFSKIQLTANFFIDMQNSKRLARKQQEGLNQIATTNNDKEISKALKEFREKVYSLSTYKKSLLDSFYSFWSESNRTTGRLRFQDEQYWELEKRIKKWAANEKSQAHHEMRDMNR